MKLTSIFYLIWIPDEDFSLFLKSLYNVAKRIVSEDDEIKSLNRTEDMTLMSDIAYLLSGQFFGIETALSLMKKENDTYYTKALLEGRNTKVLPKIGDPVIPIKVTNHRLYVGDRFGNTLGYLSFNDDRLLFGLIPLFEQKEVLLKMEVESILKGHNPAIALWVKRIPSASSTNIDSINLKIRKVLDSSY